MSIKRPSLSAWWLLLLIPLIAVLFPVATWYATEVQAAADIRSHLEALTKAGHPVDVSSLLKSFEDRSSKENTIAWGDIIQPMLAINGASYSSNARITLSNENTASQSRLPRHDRTIEVISTRGNDPIVVSVTKSLSEQAQPIIRRLQELLPDENPVWKPMEIDISQPFFEPFGLVCSTDKLLMLEVELAIHETKIDQAIEMLKLHRESLTAFDWKTTVHGETTRAEILQDRNDFLLFILGKDLATKKEWKAEHLRALIELLDEESSLSSRWRQVFDFERAVTYESIGVHKIGSYSSLLVLAPDLRNANFPQGRQVEVPATRVRDFLMELDAGMSVADKGYEGLVERASEVESSWHRRSQINVHWFHRRGDLYLNEVLTTHGPHLHELAANLSKLEDSRRFTRAALAVKLFQLEHSEWPRQISDLELPLRDQMSINGVKFSCFGVQDEEFAVLLGFFREVRIY